MAVVIQNVEAKSPAARARIKVGDTLLSINGREINDVLDYRFFIPDQKLKVTVRTVKGKERNLRIRKEPYQELGMVFDTYLMDKQRSCRNNCVFCFIDQLPAGMRPTMYFKDDDARLSFLLGNYITLTNLSDREVQRIIDLHVSPVTGSVHTTDPELRCRMLRNPHAGRGLKIMQRFADGGIQMNCQIVCCPGLNDGEELLRTMRDLAELFPQVKSVSIVPVGLTKFRDGLYPLTPFTPALAEKTIDEVTAFGDDCLERYGSRIFFCGDELYLKCGREIPPDAFYEDYVQLENGVGMLRLMETEFSSALKLSEKPEREQRFSLATGVAAAPFFQNLVCNAQKKYDTIKGQVYPIANDFFGRSIDVSGLITGRDLIAQLKGKDLGERLLISHNMIRREERDFLDDVTLKQAAEELGVPIYPVEQDGFALWDAMSGEALPELPEAKEKEAEEAFYRYNQNR